MKKRLTTRIKVVLSLAVLAAILVTVMSALSSGASFGENVTQTLLTPFRAGASALTRQIERFYNYVFTYEALEAENAHLKSQVAAMEDEVRTTDALQRENERLRQLLELTQEHEDYDLVSAYIITWDSSAWSSEFRIGKGTNSGIETGMCAITAQGQVVGLVTQTGTTWATVTTVLDSSLEVSATIASSGYNGIVQGGYTTGAVGMLRMDYLPTDAVIRNNDQVVTTGSTVYPKDLVLGYVADAGFDETGVAKYALLEPAADFDDLEQVFVITNYVNE